MNRPGRPRKNDDLALLAMAKIIYTDSTLSPTCAFRQVYPTLQGEQSEDAARVRLLRKFKDQRSFFMIQARKLTLERSKPSNAQRLQVENFGRLSEAMQQQLNGRIHTESILQASRQIEAVTARYNLSGIAQSIQSLVDSAVYPKKLQELAAAMTDNRLAALTLIAEKLAANDLYGNAARLCENATANNALQQAVKYATQPRY